MIFKTQCSRCSQYFVFGNTTKTQLQLQNNQPVCENCHSIIPEPIQLNFQHIRNLRQTENNNVVVECLSKGNVDKMQQYINECELDRVLNETQLNITQLVEECQRTMVLSTILAGRIAKKSSRQGNKDELVQIETCNQISTMYGIQITVLNKNAYRPTKCGKIVSHDECKTQNIEKNVCLKSFDAQITGKMNGWVFAKVVFGNGGHQDNVFEEADTMCEWVCKYNQANIFVVLIDTDLLDKLNILKTKYSHVENIWVCNHVEFQRRLIDTYHVSK